MTDREAFQFLSDSDQTRKTFALNYFINGTLPQNLEPN